MKKLLFTLLAGLYLIPSLAQNTGDHCVAFKIAMPDNTQLSEQNQRTLELKCTQIVTRSKAARTAFYSAFAIVPYLDITDQRSINAGTANISVVEAELTMIAMNLYDQSLYGSVVVKLKGSGNSPGRAFNSLLQSTSTHSAVFVNFIKQSTEQIIDYYDKNMPRVLALAQNLVQQERYEDAVIVLSSIPFCVPTYMESSAAIGDLMTRIAERDCESLLTMARRNMEAGEYEAAKEMLLAAKAGTPCNTDIQSLLQTIRENEQAHPAKQ